jgi:hypothetical protein
MLFDLRGRGRRRTVQGIYLGLAVLMGGGLVFFGIGGATNGGLLNAVNGNGSSSAGGFQSQVKAAQKRVSLTPSNPAAWAALTHVQFLVAGQGTNYDVTNGAFTAAGRAALTTVKSDWTQYLALNPTSPNSDLAAEMVEAFGTSGLSDYPDAAKAAEIVAAARPSSSIYIQLASFAYAGGNARLGDLAAGKAVSLAPAAQQATLKTELASARAQALKQAATTAAGASGAPTTTPSASTTTPPTTVTTAPKTKPKH